MEWALIIILAAALCVIALFLLSYAYDQNQKAADKEYAAKFDLSIKAGTVVVPVVEPFGLAKNSDVINSQSDLDGPYSVTIVDPEFIKIVPAWDGVPTSNPRKIIVGDSGVVRVRPLWANVHVGSSASALFYPADSQTDDFVVEADPGTEIVFWYQVTP